MHKVQQEEIGRSLWQLNLFLSELVKARRRQQETSGVARGRERGRAKERESSEKQEARSAVELRAKSRLVFFTVIQSPGPDATISMYHAA